MFLIDYLVALLTAAWSMSVGGNSKGGSRRSRWAGIAVIQVRVTADSGQDGRTGTLRSNLIVDVHSR